MTLHSLKNNLDEKQLRVELAAAYHLVHHYGMTDQVSTHISARVSERPPVFLINAFGLLFDEVRASNLVKIDVDGNRLDETSADVNRAGFTIHSAIHMQRPDVVAVLHTHTIAGMAVAAMEEGLLPLNQISLEFQGRLAYHDYEGISDDLDERDRLVDSLGENYALVLRNHGLLTVGRSVAEAFYYMYYLNKACEIQVATLSMTDNPRLPLAEVCEHAGDQYGDENFHINEVNKMWEANIRLLERTNGCYRD